MRSARAPQPVSRPKDDLPPYAIYNSRRRETCRDEFVSVPTSRLVISTAPQRVSDTPPRGSHRSHISSVCPFPSRVHPPGLMFLGRQAKPSTPRTTPPGPNVGRNIHRVEGNVESPDQVGTDSTTFLFTIF